VDENVKKIKIKTETRLLLPPVEGGIALKAPALGLFSLISLFFDCK
jgi:hypothetical protein